MDITNSEEKKEFIVYLLKKCRENIPVRFRGAENAKKRRNWKEFTKKMRIKERVENTAMLTEIIVHFKNSDKILLTKEQLILKLIEFHNSDYHYGRDKMMFLFQDFFLPNKKKIIESFLSQCLFCLRMKGGINKPKLKPIITTKSRERVVVDLFECPIDAIFFNLMNTFKYHYLFFVNLN